MVAILGGIAQVWGCSSSSNLGGATKLAANVICNMKYEFISLIILTIQMNKYYFAVMNYS